MHEITIRVYGLLEHNGHVLVADELIRDRRITKFPGGGLEPGEGLLDCLVREVREELAVQAMDITHFYTTDFHQQSAFHARPMQVIGVYYTFQVPDPGAITVVQRPFEGLAAEGPREVFRWLPLHIARPEEVSLPIDRHVLRMLLDARG